MTLLKPTLLTSILPPLSFPSTPSPYPAPSDPSHCLTPHTPPHTALLPARHPRWYPLPVAGAVALEGKARDGEGEEEEEDSPQRGAEPKKTIPKAKYTGEVSALYNLCASRSKPDMRWFNSFIEAGAPIRWTVRRNGRLRRLGSPFITRRTVSVLSHTHTHMQYTVY